MILYEGEWVVAYEFSLFAAKIEVGFRVPCILRNQSTLQNLNTPRFNPFHQFNWPKILLLKNFEGFWRILKDCVIFFEKYTFRNMSGLIRNLIMFIIPTRHLTYHQKVNFKRTLWNHRRHAHTCKFAIVWVSYSPGVRDALDRPDCSIDLFRINLEL